jgi:hypothetical protein
VSINDLKCDKSDQWGVPQVPQWSGYRKVSEKVENFHREVHFFFCLKSAKKKRFEKRPNVCKWLKILYNSCSGHPGGHFKLFRLILALKLTEIQASEITNFGSSSIGRRPKNIEEFLSKVCRTAHSFL